MQEHTSQIGVPHLVRLWSRLCRNETEVVPLDREWLFDKITIHGLGLSLEETIEYLSRERPAYRQFEIWIREKKGDVIQQTEVERINAAIAGSAYDELTKKEIADLEYGEPVLTEADLEFFSEFGYVIVPNAIATEQCQATVNAICNFLEVSQNDPATWYSVSRGHMIMVQLFQHEALQANRRSYRIRKAFAQVWQTADLWTSIDRVSFNPPEREGWTFPGPHLHWDTSLALPIEFSASGIVYLTDTAEEQGAFTCVPGFHRRIVEWLHALPPEKDPRAEDLEALGATPIAGKAGDLIIWNEALPHGSRPNTTDRPRFAQYITMYPPTMKYNSEWR